MVSLASLAAIAAVVGVWARTYTAWDVVAVEPLSGLVLFAETAPRQVTVGCEWASVGRPLPFAGGRLLYEQKTDAVAGPLNSAGLAWDGSAVRAVWFGALRMTFAWPLAAALASVVLTTVASNRVRRWRAGFCQACGYDLRATPDRCPECGRAPS